MSIASEISRISGNVSDALDAIEAKGVTIPTGANSDDLATLIGQISGGGTGAVSVVDTQDSHGGIVRTITAVDISDTTAVAADVASGKYFYTANGTKTSGIASGGSSWNWMGENPTLAKDYGTTKVYLKDTGYATWTPATSSTKIVDSADLAECPTDYSLYDYIIYYEYHAHFDYTGDTGAAEITEYYSDFSKTHFGYCGSLSQMISGAKDYTTSGSNSIRTGIFYKNTSGDDAYYSPAYYGVYIDSIPNSTAYTSRIIPKAPAIYAKCNSSYFSTDNAAAVNQTTSYYELKIQVWRVDAGTSDYGRSAERIREMWLNSL